MIKLTTIINRNTLLSISFFSISALLNINQNAVAQNINNSCNNIVAPLTSEEEIYAYSAWQYFVNNYQDQTGFINSTNGYPSATLWDMGNYLMALNAARWLNVIDQGEFDARLNKFLTTLSSLELFQNTLPNKVYQTVTGELVDYNNNPSERGIGWSALDIGRLLAAFHILRTCHPQYNDWLQSIVDIWAVEESVNDERLYGAAVLPEGETVLVQEGRLGYEEYAARGYELWGYKVPQAISFEPFKMVEIYGVQIPADTRNYQETNANNYVVSESYILDGIEFGFEGDIKEYAARVLEVQHRRYQVTGQLTAITEDNIDQNPYFLYNSIYANGNAFTTINEFNEPFPQLRSISTKAAFGWHYIFPESRYAKQLFEITNNLMSSNDSGFFAGIYEENNQINQALTGNTNGLILEILYYKARGSTPIIGNQNVGTSTGTTTQVEVIDEYPLPANVQRINSDNPILALSDNDFSTVSNPASISAPQPTLTPEIVPQIKPNTVVNTDSNSEDQDSERCRMTNYPIPLDQITPLPLNPQVDKLSVPKLNKQLSISEKRYAQAAWNYFEANLNPQTGLVSDSFNHDGATLWGLGDYLAALQSAYALEIISSEKFDQRVRSLLGSLSFMPLSMGELPYRAYNINTLNPTDYALNPCPGETGWSGLDVGRMLIALHNLKQTYPQYTETVDAIALNWSYFRVINNGQVNNAVVDKDKTGNNQIRIHPATLFGYEEYAARGYQLWGFDASQSQVSQNYETITLEDIEVPIHRQDKQDYPFDPGYVVSNPFLVYGLELGFDPAMKKLIEPLLKIQEKRFNNDGNLTAAATTLMSIEPYAISSSIVADKQPWKAIDTQGNTVNDKRIVSSAAAFAYYALFPEQKYTRKLWESSLDLYNSQLGFYEGFYEETGEPAIGFSSNTNSLILQSLLYRATNHQPLVSPHRNFDSPWWQANQSNENIQGLPQSSQPTIKYQSSSGYWQNMP